MTAAQKTFRLAHIESSHTTAYAGLSGTPQSLATVAAGLGITADAAEKKLSLLIDESLASRTVGSRTTATYVSV